MYIARQAILNRALKIYGYELLYRSDYHATKFIHSSSDIATAKVLGDLFESGIDKITNNVLAFINFDYNLILSDTIELIDPEYLVIEVLENTKVDLKLLNRIQYLKKRGYRIALDDFEEPYTSYPLVPLANIIKYDIINTPLHTIELDVEKALQDNKILLAEKVETHEEYIQAMEMGFHLFQGYFFSKPSIISKSINRKSTKLQYIRIMDELKKPEPSYQYIAEIIESDVNLSYRLMKIIKNRSEQEAIHSIKRALVYMGLDEIERWVTILMVQELATDKPKELIKLSLVRSKFGESIANNTIYKNRKHEISMMCLFSTLDAILEQAMEKTLSGILLSDDIKDALIYRRGPLKLILELIYAYEQAQWDNVSKISKKLNINDDDLYKSYLYAIETSSNILKLM